MGLFSGGRKKSGSLIKRERLFRADTYECSVCGAAMGKPAKACPKCGAQFTRSGYDPQWVDELEMFDAIFDD